MMMAMYMFLDNADTVEANTHTFCCMTALTENQQSIGRTFLARRQASARLGVLFQDSTRAHGDVQN